MLATFCTLITALCLCLSLSDDDLHLFRVLCLVGDDS